MIGIVNIGGYMANSVPAIGLAFSEYCATVGQLRPPDPDLKQSPKSFLMEKRKYYLSKFMAKETKTRDQTLAAPGFEHLPIGWLDHGWSYLSGNEVSSRRDLLPLAVPTGSVQDARSVA
jgi:hypothetical protein